MVRTNRCEAMPATEDENGQTCTTWGGCASGRRLAFCIHPGGHVVEARWLAEGLAWLRARDAEMQRH
jgi:hypothetical protein